eukprot:GGOE01012956.1.p3 GENE.GGOE01012956.1~~GGOE01012956.1.p3  ORF type:complete len:139 (+),score=5.93 GGOE01012956.1:1003-1419(+)
MRVTVETSASGERRGGKEDVDAPPAIYDIAWGERALNAEEVLGQLGCQWLKPLRARLRQDTGGGSPHCSNFSMQVALRELPCVLQCDKHPKLHCIPKAPQAPAPHKMLGTESNLNPPPLPHKEWPGDLPAGGRGTASL